MIFPPRFLRAVRGRTRLEAFGIIAALPFVTAMAVVTTPGPDACALALEQEPGAPDPAQPAASTIPGLVPQRLLNTTVGVGARWATVVGADDFNQQIESAVSGAIESFVDRNGLPAYAPQAHDVGAGLADRGCVGSSMTTPAADLLADPSYADAGRDGPSLAITCELVDRGGPELEEHLRFVESDGQGAITDRVETIAGDLSGRDPIGNSEADCTLVPCVALTFDDGPDPHVAGILDEFDARHASGTFFFIGDRVAGFEDVVGRVVAEGHELGNHTWSHPNLGAATGEEAAAEFAQADAVLEAASGAPVPLVRPPYGASNADVVAAAGRPVVLWDIDTGDTADASSELVCERAVDEPHPGSIVVMHSDRDATAKAVPAALDGLADRGFSMVTVSGLYGGQVPDGIVKPFA